MQNKATKVIMLKYVIKHPFALFHFIFELNRMRLNSKYSFKESENTNSFSNFEDLLNFMFPLGYSNKGSGLTLVELLRIYDEGIQKIRELYGEKLYSILSFDEAVILYFSILLQKPEIVVESGVSDGMSSLFILNALKSNGTGRLYSIDFPDVGMPIIYGKEPGWIVPEHMRTQWDLILGKSKNKLPILLERLKFIDIFIHDSEHSYQNMKFEFNCALQHSHEDSIIMSDDVAANHAFMECLQLSSMEFKVGTLNNSESDFAIAILRKKSIS